MYSTAAFEFINDPLRDQERRMKGEPHPLPITVAFIREGLRKLRAVAAHSAQANQQAPPPALERTATHAPRAPRAPFGARWTCTAA